MAGLLVKEGLFEKSGHGWPGFWSGTTANEGCRKAHGVTPARARDRPASRQRPQVPEGASRPG